MITRERTHVRRSLFWLLGDHGERGESLAAVHTTAIEHARLADALGFASLWLAEHHFDRLGTAANPAVVLSAIAQHTERIRLGAAVSVLPLRNPIQVAEDYALVDILSGGRLDLGVGAGNRPAEFVAFGADFEGRQEAFEAALDVLERRWAAAISGERGGDSLNVAPLQRPSPPIYVASNRAERAFEIGRRGHSLLTIASPAVEGLGEIRGRIEAHGRGLADGGHAQADAEVVVMVLTHVAESEEAARSAAVPALGRFIESLAGAAPPDPSALYDAMLGRGTGLFGTAPQLAARIERFAEVGVEHVAFVSGFGGMPASAAERCLRLIAPRSEPASPVRAETRRPPREVHPG